MKKGLIIVVSSWFLISQVYADWDSGGISIDPKPNLDAIKDNFIFIAEDIKIGAGDFSKTITTVPLNTFRIITVVQAYNQSKNIDRIRLFIVRSTTNYEVATSRYNPAKRILLFIGLLVLKPDDALMIYYDACSNGDILRTSAFGYDIAQNP